MGASDDTGTWSGAAGVSGGATGVSGGAVGLLATTPRRVAVSPPKTCIFHPFAQAAFIVPCGSMGMSPGSGFRSNVRPPTCHDHSRHLLTVHQPPTHQNTSSFMFFSPNDLTDRTPPTWAQCACRRALARGAVILPATLGPEP